MPKRNREHYTQHQYRGITLWIPENMKFEGDILSMCIKESGNRKVLAVPSAFQERKKG
ncbi:MAG TPA: hypothetical protein PLV56_05165 [Synergistales bacterium]|nr:hypothetical protein [Synergistales bacterium]